LRAELTASKALGDTVVNMLVCWSIEPAVFLHALNVLRKYQSFSNSAARQ